MNESILFVDDEQYVLDGYKRLLHRRFSIETTTNALDAIELVNSKGPYAVIVADMQMPKMNGMDLLAKLKEISPDSIRIMVTGNADQQTAVDAVNKGEVYRFLNKPCKREMLIDTLNSALAHYAHARNNRELLTKSAEDVELLTERLDFESNHDLLTGLYNRHAFVDLVSQRLDGTQIQSICNHSLCHIDIDHFHIINDTCGHLAGDNMLRTIASLISNNCKSNDLVCRIAGDEFAVFLQDCTPELANKFVADFFADIQGLQFEWEGHLLEIQASVGLVPITQIDSDAPALINAAETACHVAMERGGGQLHISGPDDDILTERLNQSQWVSHIGNALKHDRFRLYAQTIVPTSKAERGYHYEILIRMIGDDNQVNQPSVFLGAAERFNLSSRIDRWVISSTHAWLSSHPEHLEELALCSINLSGHSIGNPAMLDFILSTFDSSPVPTNKICFEITETAAISQMTSAVHFIHSLKQNGFQFALDDFGSGLSSYGYLKNLSVDYLKIDGMFVKNIHHNEIDRAIVRSINDIARVMGIETIAEFVENKQIYEHLKEIGVDFAQGYHFAKPCPLEDLLPIPHTGVTF